MSALLGLLLGLLQGLRHAFEPDHVVAVTTMISEQRSSSARMRYAVAWGVGHATTLLLVVALLMFLRAELPARADAFFEVAVSLMLITLGGRAVRHALRDVRSRASLAHEGRCETGRSWRGIGPLAMGMVHGLAGSGAMSALVAARLPSAVLGLAFVALFGAGATFGMSILAGVAGVPLRRLTGTRWGMPAVLGATGGVSLTLGLVWLLPAALRLLA